MDRDLLTAPAAALVDREPLVAALRRTLATAHAGRGAVIVVEGGPGSGKTRLAHAARALGEESGFTALAAAALGMPYVRSESTEQAIRDIDRRLAGRFIAL